MFPHHFFGVPHESFINFLSDPPLVSLISPQDIWNMFNSLLTSNSRAFSFSSFPSDWKGLKRLWITRNAFVCNVIASRNVCCGLMSPAFVLEIGYDAIQLFFLSNTSANRSRACIYPNLCPLMKSLAECKARVAVARRNCLMIHSVSARATSKTLLCLPHLFRILSFLGFFGCRWWKVEWG